jgi:adenylate cyclase class 2
MPLNIEFKARCDEPERIRAVLRDMKARPAGVDNQTDTYFNVSAGRLKLREGNIEKNLIYYRRNEDARLKQSNVWLTPFESTEAIRALLTEALGVRCTVEKRREIYFHGQTKIHVDDVRGLGSFLEVEVIAESPEADVEAMETTCRAWKRRFQVDDADLVLASYSDMIDNR